MFFFLGQSVDSFSVDVGFTLGKLSPNAVLAPELENPQMSESDGCLSS